MLCKYIWQPYIWKKLTTVLKIASLTQNLRTCNIYITMHLIALVRDYIYYIRKRLWEICIGFFCRAAMVDGPYTYLFFLFYNSVPFSIKFCLNDDECIQWLFNRHMFIRSGVFRLFYTIVNPLSSNENNSQIIAIIHFTALSIVFNCTRR